MAKGRMGPGGVRRGTFNMNPAGAVAKLKRMAALYSVGARGAMAQYLGECEAEVVKTRFGPTTTPTTLRTRSGHLRSTVNTRIEGDGPTMRGILGAWAAYAQTQEKGRAVHRSTRGKKFVPLPMPSVLTPAGVLRAPITNDAAYPGAFWLKTRSGKLFRCMRDGRGKGGGLVFLFYMVPFEALGPIPPRLGLLATLTKNRKRLRELIRKAFFKSARDAGLQTNEAAA